MEDILDQEIKVLYFKIGPSEKRPGTDMLTLQIEFDGKKRVIFTGSKRLIETMNSTDDSHFPFTTIIKKEYKSFIFT